MELKRFKQLTKQYTVKPVFAEVLFSQEYDEYVDAFHNNQECRDWELKRRIKAAGINYKNYCCIAMAYYLIEDKVSKNNSEINYDSIMRHTHGRKEFGIPIHDGGSSYIRINYCPWCGVQLPVSL
ncbi:MAG: hypothetical protein K0S23_3199 [Fluviicola sp.]|jgi:hypothetical protein|uniref:DUF6980 family protein n=1 Tax=Fluviicola sp. TaxID=1917219 RepID=UPI0026363398|nr:hypothetical protein [Fluviicola sp.]MDF3028892.1 hypothetical protein [Fluviicola sp.]